MIILVIMFYFAIYYSFVFFLVIIYFLSIFENLYFIVNHSEQLIILVGGKSHIA